MRDPVLHAVFDDPGRAAAAVTALHEAGFADVRAAMPAPFPALLAALGPPSPLGLATYVGGALGILSGFALCIGTALAWPIVTGGKEIVTLPPYVVIAFELCVLLGGLGTVFELWTRIGHGRRRDPLPIDPRFSNDRIGLFVRGADGARAEEIVRGHGAEEVRHVG